MGDLVTIIEIWVTCTCLTMNAHTTTMKNEDYKTMDSVKTTSEEIKD